ncbi:T9SS type A sorting domain-containing protein, partial [Flavobacterium hauense]
NDYDPFLNGQQKYWKVYLNNGSGFSATATQWNIPAVLDEYEHRFAYDYHVVVDMNGDSKPDLVHTENPATNNDYDPFLNGQQKYWKVYLSNGSGFSATATQWNIPVVLDEYEHRFAYDYHVVVDMNGDLKPDLIHTENPATNNEYDPFLNGQQKYWKVYLNNSSTLGTVGFENTANQISIYPNPSNGIFKLELKGELAQDYTLEIFNLQGQRVYQNSLINLQEIDLSNQADGMYLLKFSDGQSTFTKKIVKE